MVSVQSSQAGSGRIAGFCANKAFASHLLLVHEGEHFRSGFQLRRPPAKQQGPGSQRQPRPSLAYGAQRPGGEKGKRCFAEQRRIGAVVCSPRRVSLSRMQHPEWSMQRSIRCGLGAKFPSWPWVDCWGLRPEGIFLATPASPRRRTRLEWLSSSGDHQQSSRAQAA